MRKDYLERCDASSTVAVELGQQQHPGLGQACKQINQIKSSLQFDLIWIQKYWI
jgi:hypothetical protein